MSGILKKIGKVFKKVVSSKIFKVIAIAAAVYFTAGVALAAGGSAFAAGLPGITAAGQAVGLSGVGAIAATGAEVGAAAAATTGLAEAGVLGGAAEGGGGAIAGMSGVGGVNTAAVTAGAGLGFEAPLSALADEAGGGLVGSGSAIGTEAAGGAGSTFGTSASTATGFGGVGKDAAVTAAKGATEGSKFGADLLTWIEKNPTVSKAAMQFGSDGLKTGIQMFAQKSNQDAAEERYNQDRADYVRRSASPGMTIPKPAASQYATGLVNEVAGLKS
jgi:hypothetical protein